MATVITSGTELSFNSNITQVFFRVVNNERTFLKRICHLRWLRNISHTRHKLKELIGHLNKLKVDQSLFVIHMFLAFILINLLFALFLKLFGFGCKPIKII